MSERRQTFHTPFSARIRVTESRYGDHFLKTRDISEGGVFVICDVLELPLKYDDVVEVQVQGLPVPAPVLNMRVVRECPDGYGLAFFEEPAEESDWS